MRRVARYMGKISHTTDFMDIKKKCDKISSMFSRSKKKSIDLFFYVCSLYARRSLITIVVFRL